jgi:hypothetical protein
MKSAIVALQPFEVFEPLFDPLLKRQPRLSLSEHRPGLQHMLSVVPHHALLLTI